jgi:hypothetical protein
VHARHCLHCYAVALPIFQHLKRKQMSGRNEQRWPRSKGHRCSTGENVNRMLVIAPRPQRLASDARAGVIWTDGSW